MPTVTSALPSFGERYRIERELGRGGMATVYLCTDTKFDRLVAIKLLNPELAAAVGAERFHREIKIATGLTHPNILPAHDSGEAEGSLYYVMPFVEGESLRDRLNRERQLAVQDAVRITCEISSALHYAHGRGIVHRDIKPENILLESEHAVLADFGIARAITSAADVEALTQTGMSLGTPSYMSPEQAMGERTLDGRSDQYSLACVLYEMLAGQPPFTANTMQALVARHLAEPVPLISTVRPAVPDELEDVVLRALEKVAADRFATAGEFADALSGVIATTGTWARRTSTRTAQHMRTTRSNRAVPEPAPGSRYRLFIIAGVVALSLVAGGVGTWQWKKGQAGAATLTGADSRRIAVLYFDDDSKNGELRYLADGLTESLIDELSQISALDVISRNGVEPFRGRGISPDSVGRGLGVGSVVRGAVEPTQAGVRVTVRLDDARSGGNIGRKGFEYDTRNVLALQDSVASEVAAFLRLRLGDEVRLRQRKLATRSADAWTLLQRGERRYKDADSLVVAGALLPALGALVESDSQLAAAAAADPKWAAPHALRASVAYARAQALTREPTRLAAVVDSGLAHAERALAIDPRNADAMELKGRLLYLQVIEHLISSQRDVDRTLAVAESTLTRAVQANPAQAGAWEALGALHYRKPDLQAVINAFQKAYDSDAYLRSARTILRSLFLAYYNLELFPEAMGRLNEFKRRFPNDPYFAQGRIMLYRTRLAVPDIDSAWTYLAQYMQSVPAADKELQRRKMEILVAGALANAQLPDSARRVLTRARAPSPQLDPKRELPINEAAVRVMLGDHDTAVDLIKDYLTVNPEHRRGFATGVGWYWRGIQDNPKFKALTAGLQ